MDLIGGYQRLPFPRNRELVIDVVELGLLKHHVPSLIELDVTEARRRIRRHGESSGERLSFTGWMAKCIAQAVSEHRQMHAIRYGRKAMIVFDDVDILITVQKVVGGNELPLPWIVRKANEKTVEEIHSEIRAAQAQAAGQGDMVLGANPWFARFYLRLPKPVRRALGRRIMLDPFFIKKNSGTVGISSIGMMAHFGGWAIPVSPQPLMFALGGIARKPGIIDDRVEIREYLSLSFVFDHDVVDGAPVARFTGRLTELAELGFGLPAGD